MKWRTRQSSARRLRALLLGLLGCLAPGLASALPVTGLWLSEVMFDPTGGDNGREWVELYNSTGSDIDLSGYSLGWGGVDYATNVLQLSGTIPAGGYFVIGGPTSDAGNAGPSYDQIANFAPDLENPFIFSDGIALFDVPAASVTGTTLPIHVVIYGGILNVFLIDEQGNLGVADVGFAPAGQSLEFGGASWAAQATPSPGAGLLASAALPEPRVAGLLLLGLAAIGRRGRIALR